MTVRTLAAAAVAAVIGAASLVRPAAQATPFFPLDQVKPGMVAVGRTIFQGNTLEEFRAHIIGVLKNTVGPRHDLILARLEGGPLATTGVMQGMSGSPVYIDGKLVGAVSYALGSFPREPIAGITPIAEMTEAVDGGNGRVPAGGLDVEWPATPQAIFAALGQVAARAAAPLATTSRDLGVVGPASLADLAPSLKPIGAAMVLSGLTPTVDRDLRAALGVPAPAGQAPARPAGAAAGPLRPGDAVGMSLMRGDMEMGATGTVTHVDGARVYAFGHPFLNLGTTAFAMTQAQVMTILPSLQTSMKIAALGPVIGTISQDRSTAVGGRIGEGPRELHVTLTLASARAPERTFDFHVIHDQSLTALFAYVAILNTLVGYERQNGPMSLAATGEVSFGADGTVAIDDVYSGDNVLTQAPGGITAAIGAAIANDFKPVMPERLTVRLEAAERQQFTTIERAWLDTTRPRAGATHTVSVMLRDYRGATETIAVPVTMPAKASGPLKLLVTDGPTLSAMETRELRPGKPSNWPELLKHLQSARANNRVYVRLIDAATGTVVGGDSMPALPASARSVFQADSSIASADISRIVLGAWEHRLNRAVRGSREITLTLEAWQ
jgi:hypothetical protein